MHTMQIVNAIQRGNDKLLRALHDNTRELVNVHRVLQSVLGELEVVGRHVTAIRRNPPPRRSRSPGRDNQPRSVVKKIKK